MSEPTVRQLRTLLAVVETGGISTAARRLGITQPAASQQLRELERGLGVRLLERAAGQTRATAAGEAALGPARRVLAAVADAQAAAAAFRTGEAGRIRIGTGATACIHLLPLVLAEARRRMPGLEVVVATGNSSAMARLVEAGELDVALVTMPIAAAPALTITSRLTDPLVALIPASMADAQATIEPASLAALPLILYEPEGSTRMLIDAWFRTAGVTPLPIMQLDSVETIKVLVGGGLGASVLPALALPQPVPATVVRPLNPPAWRELGIVLRREKVMDRSLRVMLQALVSAPGPVYTAPT
jgi:DNA-binding transcriptional LysR family regulator